MIGEAGVDATNPEILTLEEDEDVDKDGDVEIDV